MTESLTVDTHRASTALSVVREGQLDLWLTRQPPAGTARTSLALYELDNEERRRAESFLHPANRLLYTTAHIARRRLLGAYLGVPPQEVRFIREKCPGCGEPHGRPAVAGTPPLHFSLSHSSGLALIGIAAAPVGVDVQKLPGAETVELCSPALHPAERTELERLPAHSRRVLFGRLWTRKEAYLKGIGTGLSRDPAADYLGDGGHGTPERPPGWTVIDVPCGTDHAAAAAVLGDAPRTTVRWFPQEWLYLSDATDPIECRERMTDSWA